MRFSLWGSVMVTWWTSSKWCWSKHRLAVLGKIFTEPRALFDIDFGYLSKFLPTNFIANNKHIQRPAWQHHRSFLRLLKGCSHLQFALKNPNCARNLHIDKCASPALDTNAPGARARLCQYETHNTRPSPALSDNTTSSNAQHLSRLFQSTSERQSKVLVVPVIFICFRSWLFLLLIVYKGPRG